MEEKKRKEEKGLNPKFYKWYLDLRESNPLPRGGFGLGIERLVRWIANERDITYTVPFPNKPYSPNRFNSSMMNPIYLGSLYRRTAWSKVRAIL